jgi:predicted Zn-dependent peptidase
VDRVRAEGVPEVEMERAKTQLKVALALAAESTSFRMQHLALSELYWGRVLSFEEIREGVDAVTAEDVLALARDAFTPGRQALVAIGPFDQ